MIFEACVVGFFLFKKSVPGASVVNEFISLST